MNSILLAYSMDLNFESIWFVCYAWRLFCLQQYEHAIAKSFTEFLSTIFVQFETKLKFVSFYIAVDAGYVYVLCSKQIIVKNASDNCWNLNWPILLLLLLLSISTNIIDNNGISFKEKTNEILYFIYPHGFYTWTV